jgi:hypothetical protein
VICRWKEGRLTKTQVRSGRGVYRTRLCDGIGLVEPRVVRSPPERWSTTHPSDEVMDAARAPVATSPNVAECGFHDRLHRAIEVITGGIGWPLRAVDHMIRYLRPDVRPGGVQPDGDHLSAPEAIRRMKSRHTPRECDFDAGSSPTQTIEYKALLCMSIPFLLSTLGAWMSSLRCNRALRTDPQSRIRSFPARRFLDALLGSRGSCLDR